MNWCALTLIVVLTLAASGPLPSAEAQQVKKAHRIGVLELGSTSVTTPAYRDAWRQALTGNIDHAGLAIDERYANGRLSRLSELAAELVGLRPNVILAVGASAASAAKAATDTIPIVMIAPDAVAAELVKSLTAPGGNVTGVSWATSTLQTKWMDILKELPGPVNRAVVVRSAAALADPGWKPAQPGPRTLNVKVFTAEFRESEGAARLFSTLVEDRPDALIVPGDPLTILHRQRILEFAAKARIPAVYGHREFAESGGLVAYGPSLLAMYRRAGTMMGKILRGAPPRSLPVEEPSRNELVINLKTARASEIAMPQSLLNRADQIIQ